MPAKSGSNTMQIIQNVLVNWMAYAVTIVIGFFLSPFLVHRLGDPVYGIWTLLGSLTGYLGLLDFGITPSIVKSVAEYRAKDDFEAMNRLATGAISIFIALGCVSLSISCLLTFFFNDLFHNPLNRGTTGVLVLLAGLNLALTFPGSVFIGFLRGYQRYDLDATVSTIALLARTALIVFLLRNGHDVVALAAATFVFDMARLAYLIRCVYRLNPQLRISDEYFDKGELKKLFGYSSSFFLIAVGTRLNFFTDSIVIGFFLSAAAVTLYSIPNRLISYLRELIIEMTGILMPAITHLHATEATERVRELHRRCTKYVALLALPGAAIFWILGDRFIRLWMGPGYENAFALLQILTIGIVAHLIGTPTGSVLTGMGRQNIVARFAILQAVTNQVLSLLLVKPLGLTGIALGTTISMVGFFVCAQPIYFRHYLKQPLGLFVRSALLLPMLAQLPFIGILLAIKLWWSLNSLISFFLSITLALVPYGLIAVVFCLGQDERRAFARIAERFGIKLAARTA